MNTDWEKEFDKHYVPASTDGYTGYKPGMLNTDNFDPKSFIREQLQAARQEGREEAVGYIKLQGEGRWVSPYGSDSKGEPPHVVGYYIPNAVLEAARTSSGVGEEKP